MIRSIKKLLERSFFLKKMAVFMYRNSLGKYVDYRYRSSLARYGSEILEKIDRVFNELEVQYWLDFGTLLGVVRENDFMAHDDDLDIGMWLSDYNPKIERLMKKYGFTKIREIKVDNGNYGYEESYIQKGVHVDIFFFTRVDTKEAFYHDFVPLENCSRDKTIDTLGGLVVREITLPLERIDYIDFKDGRYPIPAPSAAHLIGRYGDSYMLKDTNWDIRKGNQKSVRILEDKVGVQVAINN